MVQRFGQFNFYPYLCINKKEKRKRKEKTWNCQITSLSLHRQKENKQNIKIMKAIEVKQNSSVYGKSFHGSEFNATVNELRKLFGEEDFMGEEYDKTQHDWAIEGKMDNGRTYGFSIYDWKEYRFYGNDETISWHIGGDNKELTDAVRVKVEEMLMGIR